MKLLMITRKVDQGDALAGFTYNWVKKLGSNLDELYVITWQKSYDQGLPENIHLRSLPNSKLLKIFVLQYYLFKFIFRVDGLFCHMNPEYTLLSAWLFRLFNKRVVSWYTHRKISWKRRLVEIFATQIVTASNLSFRQPWFPKKIKIIGHGIDTDYFRPSGDKNENEYFEILSVGRISPTKKYELILQALAALNNQKIRLKIIGDVILDSQKKYLENLKEMVTAMGLNDQVEFLGWIANKDTLTYYQQANLFINMSGTGSVDKVVLEAMSCGVMVLTGNEAFQEVLSKDFLVDINQSDQLADKIRWIIGLTPPAVSAYAESLRKEVIDNHNLDKLAVRIISQFNGKTS